ncbi:uncharacterized protein PHACADRAFT_255749 [Phanerochaete carnosa HHB-10118-sp]|uniref:Uncharacterized protein n=1 Tax=Phanerochaete carnosa (strain HHB-10118-sp) TaxID=650164 RepID=K5W8G4_PHACS|nr:uncharacterized protein PHACADRAFT_255749 [Phanerochaete carnosa HHB-10118-sp]EKM55259.1 hypothetical protein PHACADRAFT_255749 [Phanerochaete carnosa HHB-10118-sp]
MSFKLALLAVLVTGAFAQTSLYIPGVDPQSLSAEVLGVGSDGETTYLIQPAAQATTDPDDVGLGPATLVAGPTAAKLTYNDPSGQLSLDEDCAISDGIANCNVVAVIAGVTSSSAVTETVSAFELQGGNTVAAASATPASGASSDASSTPTSAPASAPSGESSAGKTAASQTGSGTSGTNAPAPTQSDNGVTRLQAGAAGLFAAAVVFSVLL